MKRTTALVCLVLIFALAACSLPWSAASQPSGLTASPGTPGTPSATLAPPPTPTPIPEVRIVNGDAALLYGDYTNARLEFQQAYDGTPSTEIRAKALWGLGRTEYEDGNYAQSLNALRDLIASYPQSSQIAQAYFLLGMNYAALMRYAEAATAYSTYLNLQPGLIEAYANERLGDALLSNGDYTGAIAAYQEALAAPASGERFDLGIKIANTYADSGDNQTALILYDDIAARTTSDFIKAQMDFLAGQIYLDLGQSDTAYQRFLHAVENYPLSYDAYSALVYLVEAGVAVDELNRGLVDFYAGQYGVALAAFDRYLESTTEHDGTVHYYRALTLREMGLFQEAINEFGSFTSSYPNNRYWEAAWDEKVFTQWYYLADNNAAAQTCLDFVYNHASHAAAASFLLRAGRMLERAGRLEEAAATWERLAEEYPASELVSQGLFWAGITHYRIGDISHALITFQRDLILSSTVEDQSRAYFWIGKMQSALGDSAAAQTALQQSAALDPTGYYSERARDTLLGRQVFEPPSAYPLTYDPAAERLEAETWIRIVFNLEPGTDLSNPGSLLADERLKRGTELWNLGLYRESQVEFENLYESINQNPADCYRLANYMLNLGLYNPAIVAIRQVLSLAGMETNAQTMAAPRYFNHVRYGMYYQELVETAAQQNNLHPLLLFSIMRQESLFDSLVGSAAGALGLMQITPETGQQLASNFGWPLAYSTDDLYRPVVSINLGAHYLANNRSYLEGDLYATLAAYNAGPGNARMWKDLAGSDPDLYVEVVRFEETRTYIRSIYEIFVIYRSLYGNLP